MHPRHCRLGAVSVPFFRFTEAVFENVGRTLTTLDWRGQCGDKLVKLR